MAKVYTKEELNSFSRETLMAVILSMQDQISQLNTNMERLIEQIADANNKRYGRSSEKLETISGQMELELIFNEAEALTETLYVVEPAEEDVIQPRHRKSKGKREADLKDLPVEVISHTLSEEKLRDVFGTDGWKQLPDEIYKRVRVQPAVYTVEEHHVAVYAGKDNQTIIKADRPKNLLRNSLLTPSLAASIMNAKYVNGLPLYRISQEFLRNDIHISRQVMANWMIQCADRYLGILYDRLHRELYQFHVLQADETPVLVSKENRTSGSRHYMWVYRTGKMYQDKPIVLYEYQPSRNADHPRVFLKDFQGICVTDGYQVYHTLEKEREDLRIAGCWAHARRRFDEALKALPKEQQKDTIAYFALKQIQAIYREENKLEGMNAQDRLKNRQLTVKPLVDAYFTWVKKNVLVVAAKSKTANGLTYSINQETYLRTFLEDGEVPMDNNAAEQSIRPFCIGKKNWVMIDTIAGAESSSMIYSIAETAKANHLKPYNYFEYLLTEIPKHMDDTDRSFLNDLVPWSEKLPESIRKPKKSN